MSRPLVGDIIRPTEDAPLSEWWGREPRRTWDGSSTCRCGGRMTLDYYHILVILNPFTNEWYQRHGLYPAMAYRREQAKDRARYMEHVRR